MDGEIVDRLAHVSRRHMFSLLGKAATTVAAPAVVLAGVTKAYGQAIPNNIADVLNFALALEYLESEFYLMGNNSPGLYSDQYKTIFETIRRHEQSHVRFLREALGSQKIEKPNFDFTAKGTFPDVFRNFATYSAVAQAFEDTGVRAYKGQAPNLMSAPMILQAALNIHSVEARHAARIRLLRGYKGYITGSDPTGITAAAASYAGEDNVVQGGVNLVSALGKPADRVSEAFDEPLSKEAVLAIVKPFFA